MILKADKGMRHHNRNAVFRAGTEAVNQLRNCFFTRFPHLLHPAKRRMNQLVYHADFISNLLLRFYIRAARIIGKKTVKADFMEQLDLFNRRQLKLIVCSQTKPILPHTISLSYI